ncbi:MAG: hypothetical protein ACLFUI_11090 [Halanaerobiales bacterium]
MILPKGSKLICQNCGTAIFELKVEMGDERENTIISVLEIEPLNDYEPKVGEYPKCPKCMNKTDMYKPWNYKKPGED